MSEPTLEKALVDAMDECMGFSNDVLPKAMADAALAWFASQPVTDAEVEAAEGAYMPARFAEHGTILDHMVSMRSALGGGACCQNGDTARH